MEAFIPIIGLFVVVWLAILLLWQGLVRILLRWQAITVEGHVIDRSRLRLRYGTSYYIKYTYSYQGKIYTHKAKVDEASYHIWSEGGKVAVRCFPAFAYIGLPDV